jgi:hypothetical protein
VTDSGALTFLTNVPNFWAPPSSRRAVLYDALRIRDRATLGGTFGLGMWGAPGGRPLGSTGTLTLSRSYRARGATIPLSATWCSAIPGRRGGAEQLDPWNRPRPTTAEDQWSHPDRQAAEFARRCSSRRAARFANPLGVVGATFLARRWPRPGVDLPTAAPRAYFTSGRTLANVTSFAGSEMPLTDDSEALTCVVACRESELARALARFDRADAAASANGNFMRALVFAFAGAVAALHPHLGVVSIVLIVAGGLLTLLAMMMAALSWNPTATRGVLAQKAARLSAGPFASRDVIAASAVLSEKTSFNGCSDSAATLRLVVRGLEARTAAANSLANWCERRTGKLGFWNTTAFLFVAAGTILALAQR